MKGISQKLKYILLLSAIISLSFLFYKKKVKAKKNGLFVEIPLQKLRHSDFYYLDIEIENLTIPVLLDTGFETMLTIRKYFLDKIKNKQKEINYSISSDINNNQYENIYYYVNSIKIAALKLDATVQVENLNFLLYGSKVLIPNENSAQLPLRQLSKSSEERLEKNMGRFGSIALKKHDYWIVDLPNSKMYFIDKWDASLNYLKLSLAEFIEIPLIESKSHIIIPIETDFGVKNFALDTAAAKTSMRCPSEKYFEHQIINSKFLAKNCNLGEKEIYLFNFARSFKFDGFLGIDFLKDKIILLDFKNNLIFIK